MRRSRFGPVGLALVFACAGCAGGWKQEAPPGWASFQDPGHGPNSVVTVSPPAGATAAAGAVRAAKATPATRPVAGAIGPVAGADGTRFTYRGDGASVALAGEFNGWNTSADMLTKQADGSWAIVKKLDPGKYPYKFVIDGSTWKADDAATETVDDGHGGKNSLVVVGGGAAPAAGATAAIAPATLAATGSARAPFAALGGMVFTFAGRATQVMLAGDFNQWSTSADPMQRQADGTWTIIRKLPAGSYGYKFLIDGTTWKHDEANTESKDDGFGGKNSVVTAP